MGERWDGYGNTVTGIDLMYFHDAVLEPCTTERVYDDGTWWSCRSVVSDSKPACLCCGTGEYLTRVPYGSKRDGEYLCGACIDQLLRKERSA